MSREVHVRFSEGPRVKFPRPTHPWKSGCFSASERGDFFKNSDVLKPAKMGLLGRGSVCFHLLVGPVQELLTDMPAGASS